MKKSPADIENKEQRNRFRKSPKGTRQRVNLTLDPELFENAQKYAYAKGVSVSELVCQLLKKEVK